MPLVLFCFGPPGISKAGIDMLTKMMAQELGPHKVNHQTYRAGGEGNVCRPTLEVCQQEFH